MRQYKREPLSDDDVNRLTNRARASNRSSRFHATRYGAAGLGTRRTTKGQILWQKRRLSIHERAGPTANCPNGACSP